MSDADAGRLLVRLDADILRFEEKMDRAVAKAQKATDGIVRHVNHAQGHLEKFLGKANIDEALGKSLTAARHGILEEGAGKFGILGKSLEALGPAGLAGAAGLAAFAFSAERAVKAAEFAKDIYDSARKLGYSTTALQMYRLEVEETGGAAKDADAALLGFQQKLGAAESNYSKRAIKPFAQLGFSVEDLKGFKTLDEALDAVMSRIRALGSEAERQHMAEKMGLTPMLGLLHATAAQAEEMKAKFKSMGLIMDENMIKRGAEASHQFELLSKSVSMSLNSSFLSLMPTLDKVMGKIAEIAKGIADIVDSFASIENKSDSALEGELAAAKAKQAAYNKQYGILKPDAPGDLKWSDPRNPGFDYSDAHDFQANVRLGYLANEDRVRELQDAKDARDAQKKVDAKKGPAATSLKSGIADKGAGNKPAEELKKYDEALAKLGQEKVKLGENEFATAMEREVIAYQLLDLERADAKKKIDDQVRAKEITDVHGEQLKVETDKLFDERLALEERRQANKKFDAAWAVIAELTSGDAAALRAEAANARTHSERVAKDDLAFREEQKAARKAYLEKLDRDPELNRPGAELDKSNLLANFDARQAAERETQRRKNQDPIASYFDEAPKTLEEANDKMKLFLVEGIRPLNRELLDAVSSGKKASDVLRAFFRRLLLQGAEQAMQTGEARLFGAITGGGKTPSFGVPGMGGMPAMNPGGIISGLLGMTSQARTAQPVVIQHFALDGAVAPQDLLDQANAMSRSHALQAGMQAVQTAKSSLPVWAQTLRVMGVI